jgi:hypothetical protein
MIVKRVGVASVAKIYGAITAAFGLLIGLMFATASLIGAGFADSGPEAIMGPIFGVGAIIALPIMYGVMGLIGGAIGALLYNAFAALVGGVELDIEPR